MVLYYEDVEKGDELSQLVKGPLAETDLVRYSGASGDFNPIHTVPRVAQEVGLEGVIAHGMLIMAYAGQLITTWAGPGTLRRFKVRFSGMTTPGETVVCEGRVTGTEMVDGEGIVRGRITVKGVEDGSLKLKGDFTAALPSRDA
jgi:acyl dehydratase